MNTKKIFDIMVSFENFAAFKQCRVLANGQAVRFVFACGAQYDVPVVYLLQWSPHPHYILVNGELKEWEDVRHVFDHSYNGGCKERRVIKCQRILSRTAVNIYFNDNTVYVIPWDTVLMTCEPKYEHFGGWTKTSQKIVAEWHQKIRERHPDTILYARKLRLHKIPPQRHFLQLFRNYQQRLESKKRTVILKRRFPGL